MKIHPAIHDLLHAYRRASLEMSFTKQNCAIKDDDVITHEQRIVDNGLIIIPSHELEHQDENQK
jgi:hypothetical protein